MRRNYLLILFALLLLGGCKKDREAFKSGIRESSPTFDVRVTSASISGIYEYRSDLKSVTVVYDKNSDFSSASTIPAEIHNCKNHYYYHVRLPDLEPGTTYYYYCIFDTGYGSAEGKQWSFTTLQVTVTTAQMQNITQTTATCGGNVSSDGGATVTARGVCWSTSQNPTVSDSHTTDGSGIGSFTSNITGLTENTTYYVRAYATNSKGTSYGEQKSFTTHGTIAGHEYVDLGLPSGLLWATCNVGADSPEGYGNYYAWGETEPNGTYNWNTYKWCNNGDDHNLTKYNTDSNYGIVDNKTVLDPEDDAAHVNWGGDWRMPTYDELKELKDRCTWTWTTHNGKKGRRVTGPNGNSIFLPAAGYYNNGSLNYAGSDGDYGSSSLYTGDPLIAYYLYFDSGSVYMYHYGHRCFGRSVRPVCPSQN